MVPSPDESALDRAVQVLVATARRMGDSPRQRSRRVSDSREALNALNEVERELGATKSATTEVRLLLLDIRSAQAELLAEQVARQRSMLPVLNRGLEALRATTSIDDLADAIPYHAVQLGYDRALFSWVDKEHWVPRSAHISSDPHQAVDLLQAGAAPYVHVRELLEVDVVRGRRPILVLDVEGNPRVHQRLWEVTRSDSYVAAPVVANGHVAALVHLDRNLDTGTTDEFDRDLLAAFCEGVGLMLDRLLALGGDSGSAPDPVRTPWTEALTSREREVLRLAASGLTNAQIAARLYISEETTKTHLKKLMRKLGVANRSQAGALYHRLRATGNTTHD